MHGYVLKGTQKSTWGRSCGPMLGTLLLRIIVYPIVQCKAGRYMKIDLLAEAILRRFYLQNPQFVAFTIKIKQRVENDKESIITVCLLSGEICLKLLDYSLSEYPLDSIAALLQSILIWLLFHPLQATEFLTWTSNTHVYLIPPRTFRQHTQIKHLPLRSVAESSGTDKELSRLWKWKPSSRWHLSNNWTTPPSVANQLLQSRACGQPSVHKTSLPESLLPNKQQSSFYWLKTPTVWHQDARLEPPTIATLEGLNSIASSTKRKNPPKLRA